jgi:K+-transporting ATPase ATPase A chain
LATTFAGIAFLVLLVAALAAVHVPLGDYMYRVYTSPRDWRVEKAIYRIIGADPKAQQPWYAYARSVLAFSVRQRAVPVLLPTGAGQVAAAPARSGDADDPVAGLEHRDQLREQHQLAGVLGRVDAGPPCADGRHRRAELPLRRGGHAVAMALVRGFARTKTNELGNFWVDLVRGTLRILLPISVIGAVVLLAGGVIQNFHLHDQVVTTLSGAQQTITGGRSPARNPSRNSGTNGGGFYNANSAHPFENPTVWTNWIEIFLLTG